MKKLIALTTATALVAVPGTLVLAGAASADPGEKEKRGVCAGGAYEFQVDRDNGGFELNADLDRVTPGSRWTLVLKHDGKTVKKLTRTADREGDVEIEGFRADSAGKDVFKFTAKPATGTGCSSTIVFA